MLLFALEGQRALLEAASLIPASPLLGAAPRGDGHPVLVLPGFAAGDESTLALRFYLRRLGYWAQGWRLGRNLGFHGGGRRTEQGVMQRFADLFGRRGRKVSLVGWSLGGVYAREIARALPGTSPPGDHAGEPFRGARPRLQRGSRLRGAHRPEAS